VKALPPDAFVAKRLPDARVLEAARALDLLEPAPVAAGGLRLLDE
jgi:hypothetical protein